MLQSDRNPEHLSYNVYTQKALDLFNVPNLSKKQYLNINILIIPHDLSRPL